MGIASEDGVVAVDGNMVSAFSTANIRLQDVKSLQWKLAEKKDGAVTVRIEGAGWRQLQNPLPISTAHSFAFCDPLNQVDISSTNHDLGVALPPEARIKSIVRVRDDLNVVVYSISHETGSYDIRVGIVKSKTAGGGYSLIDDDLATDSGNFCGIAQGGGGVFFVFADEPSGSSDFSAIYAYAVEARGQTKGSNN